MHKSWKVTVKASTLVCHYVNFAKPVTLASVTKHVTAWLGVVTMTVMPANE